MEFRKITAVIPVNALESVEKALQEAGAPDISVTYVKGYGDYKNFFGSDWTAEEVKLEIFAAGDSTDRFVDCIMKAAHTGLDSDGFVAVQPVAGFHAIKDRPPG